MKKVFKIIIILVFIWLGLKLITISFSFLPDGIYQLKQLFRKDSNKDPILPEPGLSYDLTLSFPTPTEEEKNIFLDCQKSEEIPPKFRKPSILCLNAYRINEEILKTETGKKSYDRIMIYGKKIILDIPFQYKGSAKDPLGDIYKIARFLDGSAYERAVEKLGAPKDPKRLYINMSVDTELAGYCSEKASACFIPGQGLFLIMPAENPALYAPNGIDKQYRYGHQIGKNKEITYWYNYVYPPNCVVPPKFIHEFTHYFNYLSYGGVTEKDMWIEEAVTRLFEDTLFAVICPPGISIDNIEKEENGKKEPVKNLDLTSAESVAAFTKSFWSDDRCKLAHFLAVNNEIKAQGPIYHQKFSLAMKKKTPKDRILSLISSSSDPENARKIFLAGGCIF